MKALSTTIEPHYILYADDDLDDQTFLSESMRRIEPKVSVTCFVNGLELVQFLEELPPHALLPCCIVLDLNMPVWDGMHTLKVLKNHQQYKSLPVFIFSTSSSERDTHLAASLGAVAYITKPYGQSELLGICRQFADCSHLEVQRKTSTSVSSRI